MRVGVQVTAHVITEAILAIALCHNVSPVESASSSAADGFQGASPDELALVQARRDHVARNRLGVGLNIRAWLHERLTAHLVTVSVRVARCSHPASVLAIAVRFARALQFAAHCGLTLHERTPDSLALRTGEGALRRFAVLHERPFSAELKRMGVLLRDEATGRITFYVKGADTVRGCLCVRERSSSVAVMSAYASLVPAW